MNACFVNVQNPHSFTVPLQRSYMYFFKLKMYKKIVMSQPVLPLSTPNVQKSSAVYKNVKKDCFAV